MLISALSCIHLFAYFTAESAREFQWLQTEKEGVGEEGPGEFSCFVSDGVFSFFFLHKCWARVYQEFVKMSCLDFFCVCSYIGISYDLPLRGI